MIQKGECREKQQTKVCFAYAQSVRFFEWRIVIIRYARAGRGAYPMIILQDLLNLTDEERERAKVKFNIYNGQENPIDLFKANPDKVNNQWLFWNKKRKYFRVGQIAICLVRIGGDQWLFTTAKTVAKDLNVINGISFEGEELEKAKKYFGRVIVCYHKGHQSQGRIYNKVCNQLEVVQVLSDIFDDDDFPGYDNVCLSFDKLERIIKTGKGDWKAALENQKAVYLITDRETGKLYVGSATSKKGMLLKRWSDYAGDGHGDNKELKLLVESVGLDYVRKNFQYTILENYNARVDDKYIGVRESYWKNVLYSRHFGYNDN